MAQESARLMLIGGKAKRTHMFARMNNFGEQVLIISLHANVAVDGALILPLPVRADGRCAFADVRYDDLFVDLDRCWEPSLVVSDNPRLEADLLGKVLDDAAPASNGVFFASKNDLARLDPKLRPPPAALAAYADFGFAVFRLPQGDTPVAPLALVFESREPSKIFFPMVQLVDDKVPEKAKLEHRLYLQSWTGKRVDGFIESDTQAREHVDVNAARGLVRGELRAYRSDLRGERKNEDLWARLG